MLSRAIQNDDQLEEILVHTGQHYDKNMSDIFFHQLKMPTPNYQLQVGSATHGKQTGDMLEKIEEVLLLEKPDLVVVYGDTNSTVAGSLAAAKLHIPIAHIEAGLRSFNRRMPEEINRIVTDHLSTWLFCPTDSAVSQLKKEGIQKGVFHTGDIMYDAILHFQPMAKALSHALQSHSLVPDQYYLATIHRAENTDNRQHLQSILQAFQQLDHIVVLPLHPRTKKKILDYELEPLIHHPNILLTEPLNYFDMLALSSDAKAIITDSGGLQKEAYFLKTPCITVRKETEWIETVEAGWNQLTEPKTNDIITTIQNIVVPTSYPKIFGDGNTAEHILNILHSS